MSNIHSAIMGYAIGFLFAAAISHMSYYMLPQTAWQCTQWDKGDCLQYTRKGEVR